ncbi:hypothetical protein CYMTET_4013 [Cymbomonas tetramitiformis]|uniref:Uncharacterized protein n=1 Tax=Cymbomonas tetramitiformis TaxID=36881 RepID=A0AAE0H1Z9_9CHLO|nr:hypothetical protein CYMTET_4013 [Cymbomonas tetramitiformis]
MEGLQHPTPISDNSANAEELRQAARRGKEGTVGRMLRLGTPVEALEPKTGRTALHLASLRGEASCVRTLLKAGADVHARTSNENTALLLVLQGLPYGKPESKGSIEALRLLLEAGAKVDVVNNAGEDVWHFLQDVNTTIRGMLEGSFEATHPTPSTELKACTESLSADDASECSKPRRELVPLELPHPTIDGSLCPSLWEQAKQDPSKTAHTALKVLDEVLLDLCMDNLDSEETLESLTQCASKTLRCIRALDTDGVMIPGALHHRLQHYSVLAAALQSHPTALRVTERGARELVAVLAELLMWCTDGAVPAPPELLILTLPS